MLFFGYMDVDINDRTRAIFALASLKFKFMIINVEV